MILHLTLLGCLAQAPGSTPTVVLETLLAADRAYSAASAGTNLVAGLAAMFADDVAMPAPPGKVYEGKVAVLEALRANPDNARSSIEWTPIRGGISADGLHGFTFGFMTLRKPDGSTTGLKYLAYWVKGAEGWKVAAYKRGPRAEGAASVALQPPSLPPAMQPATTDAATMAAHRASLDRAERDFSDLAGRIGLGAAFVRFGQPDAMNLGGPGNAGFVYGPEAIGLLVSGGNLDAASQLNWAPDRVIVASSGDLGVTIGTIHRNDKTASYPFFTIWRRTSPDAPWRYIAE